MLGIAKEFRERVSMIHFIRILLHDSAMNCRYQSEPANNHVSAYRLRAQT